MKRFFLVAMLALFGVLELFAQFPLRTIRELQEVPLDSLRRLDTLQRTVLGEWTKQRSRYFPDTVRVRGIVVVPAKVINFTSIGYNFLIADTGVAQRTQWGGLFVRPNISSTANPQDTILAIQWGMNNLQPGDYIEMTGYIDEFPAGDPVSATQIVPVYSRPLVILNSLPLSAIPSHVPKVAADFYKGPFPGTGPNGIQFSTGEPMEFMRVRLTNLIYVSALSAPNGTMNLQVQATGDQISTMDASKWFTTRGHRDPNSTYVLPPINTRIDTLWGYVLTNSGAEAPRGYRIAPIFPGDIRYGVALPFVSTHRRNPVVVTPDSSPVVSCRVTRGGVGISAVQLRYSINNSAFTTAAMTLNLADTTYRASIPQQLVNANVRYFLNVIDSVGNAVRLASSAGDGTQADTLRGFFFYNVLNRALTIQDIQTTPYTNGRTPYLGATVTLRGVLTADTANINIAPLNTGGTTSWYMQSGTAPWSGIWVVDTLMRPRRNGDSLTITGVVAENFDVTRIERLASSPTVNATGASLPSPVVQTTGTFGPAAGNGTLAAERYEGMLVRFNNVRVSNLNPTFADPTEFEIDDGSGPIIVRRDGTHNFSNIPGDTINGRRIVRLNEVRTFIQGVIYYSFNRYKICPRTNSDWGTTSVEIDHSPQIPSSYSLAQNYPNPFNPSTTIEFNLPKNEFVSVKVFNTLGQEVETLLSGEQAAGKYTVRFDASKLTTGMYFYRLQAGEFVATKKMLLVK